MHPTRVNAHRRRLCLGVLPLLLPGLGSPRPCPAQETPPLLTLTQAIQRSLAQGDRTAVLQDAVEGADLGVRLAQSAFRPKIIPNVLGSFGNSDLSNQTYRLDLTQRFATGTELRANIGTVSSQNQLGNFYSSDTTFQVSQPLLRGLGGGSSRQQLELSRSRAEEARGQLAIAEDQIAVDVAGTYYRLIAQLRLVGVAEQSAARAEALVEASEAKQRIGKVSQLDVLRARRQLRQAEGELLAARAAAEDAADQLRFLIGEDEDYEFRVETSIPQAPPPPPLEDAVSTALRRRLELRIAERSVRQAERSLRFSKNQLLPQVDLTVAVTRRKTADALFDSLGTDDFRVASFLTVSTPLDRTPQEVQYQNALIDRDRRSRELETTRRRIVMEVRRSIRLQERLQTRLAMAQEAAELAQAELEIAEIRYQRGYSDNLDLVNAQAAALAADSALVSTQAELASADVRLRATLGVLDPRVDFGGVH